MLELLLLHLTINFHKQNSIFGILYFRLIVNRNVYHFTS